MDYLAANLQIVRVVGAFVLLLVMWRVYRFFFQPRHKASRFPYRKHTAIFSPDERSFLRALQTAVGTEFEIFAKIPVNVLILPQKPSPSGKLGTASAAFFDDYFDFILCEKQNLGVVCAIQLYDKTDPQWQASESDELKAICANVALPFVQIQVKGDYAVTELRDRLVNAAKQEPFYLAETDGRKEPRISSFDDIKF